MKILAKIKNKWKKFRYQSIRVYCLHHVSAVYDADSMKINDWMDIEKFKCHILNRIKSGVQFISLEEAYSHISSDVFRRKKYETITFDDGYASILEVLPWLKEMNLPFTLFINGKYLDGQSYRDKPQEKYLTLAEIKRIVEEYEGLVDIQSHGWEHNDAAIISASEFESALLHNIQVLSGISKYPIRFHAYTWGSYTDESDDVLRKLKLIPVRVNGRLNYHDVVYVDRL